MTGRSLFLGLIGPPYESDRLTTALRIADEAVRQEHRVTVWTCGYSTTLTAAALGPGKPRNAQTWAVHFPSTSALAADLLDWAGGALEWLVCRYCAEERSSAGRWSRCLRCGSARRTSSSSGPSPPTSRWCSG